MRGMENHQAHKRNSLRLAVLMSLLLHAIALFVVHSSSERSSGEPARTADSRLQAKLLNSPSAPIPPSALKPPARVTGMPGKQPRARAEASIITRSWSNAERDDMNKFLDDLTAPAAPPSLGEAQQKALAREMGKDGASEAADPPAAVGKKGVDPFSLELYFDAFVRKLNRSAAFVKSDPRIRGTRKALVEITLNPDGTLKSYRVLHSADQQAEIAYIKSVVDRASPFSAFPPDIRNVGDSLTVLMCIFPASAGGGGGFSRSFGAQECRD